jgi:hypothetical protein
VTSSRSLFVSTAEALAPTGGGVQQCTQEYVRILKAAGFAPQPVIYRFKLGISRRVYNRIFPRVGITRAPSSFFEPVLSATRQLQPEFVFYNVNVFTNIVRSVRSVCPHARQIMLSHGLESVDFRIEQELRRFRGDENRPRSLADRMLKKQLRDERSQRAELDAVVALSPQDAQLEKELGAKQVLWLPATVIDKPLNSNPIDGRVGCASTLNHPPNRDGLEKLFLELANRKPSGFRFRLAGRPSKIGAELASRFAFVDYLGQLNDEALRNEAASWCCFVHPLFVYAKGRSTKLATALEWNIPVATTKAGARGYADVSRILPLANTSAELAESVVERSRLASFDFYKEQTRVAAEAQLSVEAAAAMIREFVAGLIIA